MKYRIDVVIGPTEESVDGYTTSATEDATTTKDTDVDGISVAVGLAKDYFETLTGLGVPVRHVCVIDEGMNISSTVNAENPNG